MSRANRQKRLFNQIKRRAFTDVQGRDNVILRTPDDWLDMHTGLPEAMADAFVHDLRAVGVHLWLYPDPTGSVRTRIGLPLGPEPDPELLRILARYARDIAKAVVRSGDYNPPPDNPFGDRPLPPGGHWDWFGI